jgi:Tol biopolymer transport system component
LDAPYTVNKPGAKKSVLFLGTSTSLNQTFLFVMGENGEEPAYVLKEPVTSVPPLWNPAASRIAYVSSYHFPGDQLLSVSPDGTDPKALTGGGIGKMSMDVDWTPDGGGLLIAGNETDRWEIYLLDAATGNKVQLSQNSGLDEISQPRDSPTGQMIAFVGRELDHSNIDLILNDRTGRIRELTKAGPRIHYANPCWSPDGKWIAAVTDRYGNREIVKIGIDSGIDERLTFSGAGESWDPRVSPDGAWICYTSNRDGTNSIYRMDVQGSGNARVLPPGLQGSQAAWYPDSKSIVFVGRDNDGNTELYRVDGAGGHLNKLTLSPDIVKSHPQVQGVR